MTLFVRVHPGGRDYRLLEQEDAAGVVKTLAEVIGSDGCVVLGYAIPHQPRASGTVILNGRAVEAVELVDVPPERDDE